MLVILSRNTPHTPLLSPHPCYCGITSDVWAQIFCLWRRILLRHLRVQALGRGRLTLNLHFMSLASRGSYLPLLEELSPHRGPYHTRELCYCHLRLNRVMVCILRAKRNGIIYLFILLLLYKWGIKGQASWVNPRQVEFMRKGRAGWVLQSVESSRTGLK